MTEETPAGTSGTDVGLAASCLSLAIAYYLRDDGDFNGLPLAHISAATVCSWSELQQALTDLVKAGATHVHWGDVDVNPHINRIGFAPKAAQLNHLKALDNAEYYTCLYPSEDVLKATLPADAYADRPYTRELALGAAQLGHRSFELQVLETYRNDPRYYYTCSDIGGSICISVEHSQGGQQVRESDQVLVETFGFSYDKQRNRAVAVFVRYLHCLSAEHQQMWRARQLEGSYGLHPDYYRANVLGDWPEHMSLLEALCIEVWLINQMAKVIRKKPLFRQDFGPHAENRPKRLALLIRPTLEEFNAAVLLLDKVLSDNISTKFFEGAIPLASEIERRDGKIEVRPKGTITLLDEYLRSVYRTDDWSVWDEAIASLRKVRKLRQSPAHGVKEDVFDPEYARQFRELCVEGYGALHTLRTCLQRHPAVRGAGIEVPHALEAGKVWTE